MYIFFLIFNFINLFYLYLVENNSTIKDDEFFEDKDLYTRGNGIRSHSISNFSKLDIMESETDIVLVQIPIQNISNL